MKLGQYWLEDEASLKAIMDIASITGGTVLEIGPGRGALTKHLLEKAEIDSELVEFLKSSYPSDKLEVIHQDIRKFDLGTLSEYKVVANIPYYLTSALVRQLLITGNPAQDIVLLVQKELAQRMAARPGDMSMLSLMVQLYSNIELGPIVEAEKFNPQPKVDSQVVHISPKPAKDAERILSLAKPAFSQKRKKLTKTLPYSNISKVLEQLGVKENIRPQHLSIDQWRQIEDILRQK